MPAAFAVQGVLGANQGLPAVPLDDSYIHFQFARSFAEGHPFVYSPGGQPVAGATSLLWPLLLALPQLIGFGGTSLIPWAWGFGFLGLGAWAYETSRAAEGVTSLRMAWLAGILVLAFSANTWFAASGMEVVPLGFLLTRCARRSAEWLEGDRRRFWELLVLALVTPMMRPEGALGTLMLAGALLAARTPKRPFALLALSFAAVPPLINLWFTGHATQTTTLVKWLPFSPYLTTSGLLGAVLGNVQLFFSTLLDGQYWSSVYVPEHAKFVNWLALPALVFAGQVKERNARAWLLVALGCGILLPATYDSFLWNRLRYLWPFAAPWLIGLAALADQLGELAALVRPRLGALRYALAAALLALLVAKFPDALWDLSHSARAISDQHVSLGQWAKQRLNPEARIGVNDTGAIAYFSGLPVFDIVGLTTADEARYWSAGPGSRFEHYEHLPARALPSHFIVYPGWFGIPDLLGTCLTERTVNATIVGGATMVACLADYARLGSGERPARPELWQQTPLDNLDIADLESEAAHGYELLPASQQDNVALSNGVLTDGARTNRRRDAFALDVVPGGRFVARLSAPSLVGVELRIAGRLIESWTIARPEPAFDEHLVTLPADLPRGRATVEISCPNGVFGSAHYWLYDAAR